MGVEHLRPWRPPPPPRGSGAGSEPRGAALGWAGGRGCPARRVRAGAHLGPRVQQQQQERADNAGGPPPPHAGSRGGWGRTCPGRPIGAHEAPVPRMELARPPASPPGTGESGWVPGAAEQRRPPDIMRRAGVWPPPLPPPAAAAAAAAPARPGGTCPAAASSFPGPPGAGMGRGRLSSRGSGGSAGGCLRSPAPGPRGPAAASLPGLPGGGFLPWHPRMGPRGAGAEARAWRGGGAERGVAHLPAAAASACGRPRESWQHELGGGDWQAPPRSALWHPLYFDRTSSTV